MKLTKITSVVLIVTAALMFLLFVLTLNLSALPKDDNTETPEEGTTTDAAQAAGNAIGQAVGITFLAILAIPLSFLYPVCGVILLVFGLLLLLKGKPDKKTGKQLTAVIVLSIIFGVGIMAATVFLSALFELLLSPGMVFFTYLVGILHMGCVALTIASKILHKREMNAPSAEGLPTTE